ncbi:MAG: hypothetical protein VXY92_01975, partial [Planctomycetota bacterium]|nr:hypothetical protein [Planctomycetota bacterium]
RARPIGFESARMATWTADRFKLVAHLGRPAKAKGAPPPVARVELFDLLEDPLERSDVAAAHPEQVASMTDALGGWRAAIRQRP